MNPKILKLESYSLNLEAVQKFLGDIILKHRTKLETYSMPAEEFVLRLLSVLDILHPTAHQKKGLLGTAMWIINNQHVLSPEILLELRSRCLDLIQEEESPLRTESLLEELQRIDYQIEYQEKFPTFMEVLLSHELVIDMYIDSINQGPVQ